MPANCVGFSRAYKKRAFRRFSDNSGHCAWVRKRVLSRSFVGSRNVAVHLSEDHELSSGRTVRRGRGYATLESYGKTSRHDEISCSEHPYGRFAQILRRGLSFRPFVGAPYQLLVHRLIGDGQLLPRFLGRQTTETGIGSSIDTCFSRRGST